MLRTSLIFLFRFCCCSQAASSNNAPCFHHVPGLCYSLLPCSWDRIIYGSADTTPPSRSNGCIVQLFQFIIVYGGRCVNCLVDDPWMFNTVLKSWSRLPSAVTPTSAAGAPIPRMQHGCALLPTPGDATHLSSSLYVIAGRGAQSVRHTTILDDIPHLTMSITTIVTS